MSSKLKLILKGSSFRVLQTTASIVIGILMMPFLLSTLGPELYGLWIVIGSIVGTYYLLDLGFNQAITRYVAKYIHQNNPEAANRVINTALVIYSLLGVVVLLASIGAAFLGAEALMKSSQNLTLAQTILIVTGLSFALEFPAKAFPGIISAYMRYDFIAIVRLSKSVADAVLIYLFISHGFGLIAMALIMLITGILSTLMYAKFSTGLFKDLRFSKKYVDIETFKDVFHFSKWVFIFDMSAMLRDKMDIWFISYYLTNNVLTGYYVAVRLVEYALQFLSQATGITGPIFTEYYAKGEVEKLNASFMFFTKLNILLGTCLIVGFYLLSESFIKLWMGDTIVISDAVYCLLVLAIGRLSVYFTTPINSLLMTINKHPAAAWISIFETILTAAFCWILIPKFGVKGAAFAIALPFIVGRLIILPVLTAKLARINFLPLAWRLLIFVLVTAIFALGVRYELQWLSHLTLLQLILVSPIVLLMQLCVGILLWDKQERAMMLAKVKGKLQLLKFQGVNRV